MWYINSETDWFFKRIWLISKTFAYIDCSIYVIKLFFFLPRFILWRTEDSYKDDPSDSFFLSSRVVNNLTAVCKFPSSQNYAAAYYYWFEILFAEELLLLERYEDAPWVEPCSPLAIFFIDLNETLIISKVAGGLCIYRFFIKMKYIK